ncbi:MAG: ABC transporter substrate-binding protein [Alphaproteobacteria bacterium]|nr:ABC transporter substrate-binding protein [Alphaproteobacteria bacterium]MBO6864020.1 ABC transporter substrate-binding protein [Alphaproteobacteria bacterium]
MTRRLAACLAAAALACSVQFAPPPAAAQETVRAHGWAISGDLKYPPGFPHFDYVNPDAPKGGTITLGAGGTYDSLNPFIIKGTSAIARIGSGGAIAETMIFDTLMASNLDESGAEYGLLAEWIEVDSDADGIFTAVRFHLREEARFHDGEPVRADDVVWTFNTLIEQGAPQYRFYYGNVAEVVALDEHTVEFRLTPGENREIPSILGQLPILPKHYWQDREFNATTLDPPLGGGPYRITDVNAGQSITIERVKDYWAKDLPVNVGQHNFDRIRYIFFRDRVVMLEALKAGDIDFRAENSAKNWATAYDVPAVEDGRIVQKEFDHERGTGMQAYVMNTRREIFQDPVVREAMTYLWDFEWVNKTIMFDAYTRTDSFYENSELEATGLPGPKELAVLEPLRDRIPERVFTQDYEPPVTDGSGNSREPLMKALELLRQAGWNVDGNRKLVHGETGKPFAFEVLLYSDLLVPHTQALKRGVERLGGSVELRVVDAAQYQNRLQTYDFDMVVSGWPQSLSPGNEQREFFGSDAAEREGGRNLAGVRDPAVDILIEDLIASPDRETLIARTKALDRVLLWNFYAIPMFHSKTDRFAFWNRFGYPENPPMMGTNPNIWWIDPELDAALKRKGRS